MQKNKVPFDYSVWVDHPKRSQIRFETRHGLKVTSVSDRYFGLTNSTRQIFGILEMGYQNEKSVEHWDAAGRYLPSNEQCDLDLFMILPEEPEMWVIVNHDDDIPFLEKWIYPSKKEAEASAIFIGCSVFEVLKIVKQ